MKLRFLLASGFAALLALTAPVHAQDKTKPAADKVKAAASKGKEKAKEADKPAAGKAKPAADKAKPAAKPAAAPAGARPFYGEVASLDAKAQSIQVGENTYYVTDTTEIHDDGKPAKFTAVKAGKKIGGSWVEKKGKRELVKLNLGVKQDAAAPAKPAAEPADKPAAKATGKPAAKPAAKPASK